MCQLYPHGNRSLWHISLLPHICQRTSHGDQMEDPLPSNFELEPVDCTHHNIVSAVLASLKLRNPRYKSWYILGTTKSFSSLVCSLLWAKIKTWVQKGSVCIFQLARFSLDFKTWKSLAGLELVLHYMQGKNLSYCTAYLSWSGLPKKRRKRGFWHSCLWRASHCCTRFQVISFIAATRSQNQ